MFPLTIRPAIEFPFVLWLSILLRWGGWVLDIKNSSSAISWFSWNCPSITDSQNELGILFVRLNLVGIKAANKEPTSAENPDNGASFQDLLLEYPTYSKPQVMPKVSSPCPLTRQIFWLRQSMPHIHQRELHSFLLVLKLQSIPLDRAPFGPCKTLDKIWRKSLT